MKIKNIKLSEIKEAPFNYNLHPQNQIEELSKSLKKFGQFKNIVLWEGYCIAGNGLVFAARESGYESLSAIIMDDLSEDQAKELCVADNATPYLAIADNEKLNKLLMSISNIDDIPGVDSSWLKNQSIEMDTIINNHNSKNDDDDIDGDDGEEPPEDFKEYDEDIETDYSCPSCGYKWSGSPK